MTVSKSLAVVAAGCVLVAFVLSSVSAQAEHRQGERVLLAAKCSSNNNCPPGYCCSNYGCTTWFFMCRTWQKPCSYNWWSRKYTCSAQQCCKKGFCGQGSLYCSATQTPAPLVRSGSPPPAVITTPSVSSPPPSPVSSPPRVSSPPPVVVLSPPPPVASPPPPVSSGGTSLTLQQAYLVPHNNERASLGVGEPNLVWDATLTNAAQAWANYLATSNNCGLSHGQVDSNGQPSTNLQYGQNLYWSSDPSSNPADAVPAWISEKTDYNYNGGCPSGEPCGSCTPGQMCGHYTQIVWKATTAVGCAAAICAGSRTGVVVACDYNPPGNYIGQYPY